VHMLTVLVLSIGWLDQRQPKMRSQIRDHRQCVSLIVCNKINNLHANKQLTNHSSLSSVTETVSIEKIGGATHKKLGNLPNQTGNFVAQRRSVTKLLDFVASDMGLR